MIQGAGPWETLCYRPLESACLPGPVWKRALDAIEDLRTLDPVKARGLLDLLEYPNGDEVEDVFCLDFSVTYRYLGMDHMVLQHRIFFETKTYLHEFVVL